MTATHEIVVHHQVGLHARPAARFVTTAAGFDADIEVENLSRGAGPANAKSILGVLSLGVTQDQAIRLTASGADEQAAVDALIALIEDNFGEEG
jgi:phosphotransferase system HPr (HPr) family protein